MYCSLKFNSDKNYDNSKYDYEYTFPKNKIQDQFTGILLKKGTSISKVLNSQNFKIRDLKRTFAPSL